MQTHAQQNDQKKPADSLVPSLRGESIICFAGEDWWYHHPHSKNHILKRLARDNRVLFVNSITMGLPSVSNPDFFLKIRRKLQSYLKWLRRVPEGLFVLTPISLPFYGSRFIRIVNRFLLVVQLRLVMLLCGIRQPIVWAAIPSAADIVGYLGGKLLLYQVSDKYDANEDTALSRGVIRDMDQQLKNKAAVVMYSGRKLFEEADVQHRYFLEQAVDFEHFAKDAGQTAEDIAGISRPVLGYFGYMDFVMDTDLIAQVAKQRPNWQWVLIGRKSNLVKISGPNIHFLGPKPYSELPRYVRHFDVCVLPWDLGNAFTRYGSAIKVREYLATGKPVVIAPLYEYVNVPGIKTYRNTQEFISAVDQALNHDTVEGRQLRQMTVRDCTWDRRAFEVGELISSLLAQSAGRERLSTPLSQPEI